MLRRFGCGWEIILQVNWDQHGQTWQASNEVQILLGKQNDLHTWWTSSSTADSRTAEGARSNKSSNSLLALLCWGFWKKTTEYGGKLYRVDALLNDPKPGGVWVPEPNTTAQFQYKTDRVVISGCFRHVGCSRLSIMGEPFLNFMCSNCKDIVQKMDFRLRVLREGSAHVK